MLLLLLSLSFQATATAINTHCTVCIYARWTVCWGWRQSNTRSHTNADTKLCRRRLWRRRRLTINRPVATERRRWIQRRKPVFTHYCCMNVVNVCCKCTHVRYNLTYAHTHTHTQHAYTHTHKDSVEWRVCVKEMACYNFCRSSLRICQCMACL